MKTPKKTADRKTANSQPQLSDNAFYLIALAMLLKKKDLKPGSFESLNN